MKPKAYWNAVRKQKREDKKAARKALGIKAPARDFNNKEVEIDGRNFSSKLEGAVYQLLKARELAGEIKDIEIQNHVYLTDARIHYIPDFKFTFVATDTPGWAEAKGFENERWPMKKRLWKAYGPGPLEIWKGSWQRPRLVETVVPSRDPTPPCLFCGKGQEQEESK